MITYVRGRILLHASDIIASSDIDVDKLEDCNSTLLDTMTLSRALVRPLSTNYKSSVWIRQACVIIKGLLL